MGDPVAVSELADRIYRAIRGSGRSVRAVSVAAGLNPTQLSTTLRRLRDVPGSTVELTTLEKIAAAIGVPVEELTAPEPPRANDVASTAPPPVSDTYAVSDSVGALVDAAFDPERHRPSDVAPVMRALEKTATLMRDHMDQRDYARYLLDAQADARAKGKRIKPEDLPFAALAVGHRTQLALQATVDALMKEAEVRLLEDGMEPPPPGEPHPVVNSAQKRAAARKDRR
jgi:lambda repressor-like predicted transcriptional regulator